MTTTNPRQAALSILSRIDRERSYADILIDRELVHGGLTGADRGLLTELVYGVLRRQGSLDYVIGQFSTTALNRLERTVLILLRLGLYQLLHLDRVPESAAVNETVKLAHQHAPRAAGFINAVLRQAARSRDSIAWPDRQRTPVKYFAARHSQPDWIVRDWIEQLGIDEAEELCRVMSEIPPLTIRTNRLKISRDALQEKLSAEGITAEPCSFAPAGLQIPQHSPLTALASYREGLFTIQDEASQIASELVGVAKGQRVLDLCSAPGGKTTYLAELMDNSGEITACDIHPRRLEKVAENARRLGISTIRTVAVDPNRHQSMHPGNDYERILVDAPCSGLGVLRRNPEGKWWKKPDDVESLAQRQRQILAGVARCLKPGGKLLYATCSTSVRENEDVVDDFLSRNPDFMLEDVREAFPEYASLCSARGEFRTWPHRHGMDGFFAARLCRMENR